MLLLYVILTKLKRLCFYVTNFFGKILFGFNAKSCICDDEAVALSGSNRTFGEDFPVLFELDRDFVFIKTTKKNEFLT